MVILASEPDTMLSSFLSQILYRRNHKTLRDSQSQLSAVVIEVFGVKDRVEFCKNDVKRIGLSLSKNKKKFKL